MKNTIENRVCLGWGWVEPPRGSGHLQPTPDSVKLNQTADEMELNRVVACYVSRKHTSIGRQRLLLLRYIK